MTGSPACLVLPDCRFNEVLQDLPQAIAVAYPCGGRPFTLQDLDVVDKVRFDLLERSEDRPQQVSKSPVAGWRA